MRTSRDYQPLGTMPTVDKYSEADENGYIDITPAGSKYKQVIHKSGVYKESYIDESGVRRQLNRERGYLARPTSKRCVAQKEGHPGQRCKFPAQKDSNVCVHHSGPKYNQNARNMSYIRRGLMEATSMLQKLGIPVPDAEKVDPREVLLDAVQQSWAVKEALKFLVTDLDEDAVGGIGKIIRVQGADGQVTVIPHEGGAMANTRLRLYNEALDRCAKLSKVAIDSGIEERLVRLAERQAEVIISVIKAAVAELPAELQFKVVKRAADELRLRAGVPVPALPVGGSHVATG